MVRIYQIISGNFLQPAPNCYSKQVTSQITILIPSYNEGRRVIDTIHFFQEHFPNLPIVVIDDGSTDESQSILKNLKLPNLTVHILSSNQGKSTAVKTGLRFIHTPWVCLFDADLTNVSEKELRSGFEKTITTATDMIVFSQSTDSWLFRLLKLNIFLSGERCVKTKTLKQFFTTHLPTHYRLELDLHYWFAANHLLWTTSPLAATNKLKLSKWQFHVAVQKSWQFYSYFLSPSGITTLMYLLQQYSAHNHAN